MLVALNFSPETQLVRLGSALPSPRWVPRLSTRRSDIGWAIVLSRHLRLAPYEATIFEAQEAASAR
jgi:hypothetical protein